MTTPDELSTLGEVFDPEVHATKRDGSPSKNRDGSFRKKRRDASAAKTATTARTRSSTGSKTRDQQRAGYVKSVAGVLQVPATLVALVDPVDGYCAGELVQPWSEVFADLALEYPQVAAAIERTSAAGPLAGVIGLGLLTLGQFAHNHGKVPEHIARMVGARPRKDIEQLLKQRGVQLAAEAEERKRQEAEVSEWEEQMEHRYADATG